MQGAYTGQRQALEIGFGLSRSSLGLDAHEYFLFTVDWFYLYEIRALKYFRKANKCNRYNRKT